ncbi:hypothetical protein BGW41_005112 [Actinomortierella wolfii]|nr:hypothetical protein BGW41_005112 [Actinomortierella wolfii]
MMAILLERAGINYVVIEKQKTFKPSSRSVCLSAVILPVLEQLGLLQDILEIARPVGVINIINSKFDRIGELSLRSFEERYGYATMVLPRPSLYNILLSRIPKERIVLGRRVLSISQSANGVLVRCSDGTNFSGDILIGADGGNSSIRQNLYKHIESSDGKNVLYPQYNNLNKKGSSSHKNHTPLANGADGEDDSGGGAVSKSDLHKSVLFSCQVHGKKTKFLPEGDVDPMEYDSYKITGLTEQLDTLPDIEESNFTIVLNKEKRYTSKKSGKDQEEAFKMSDYGPESFNEVFNQIRDHMSSMPGLTLGNLIDASPQHLMVRSILQQKVFETWYGGRVVLIGDACHKFLPTAGQSDIANIADCVCLANLLHELKSNTLIDIQAMFEAYREERYPAARRSLAISRQMQSLFTRTGLVASLVRRFTFKRGVEFVYRKMNDLSHARRLLVTYLAFPPHRGVFKRIDPAPSPRSMDHLPVFNSYEATKAYLARASEAIRNQQLAAEEAQRRYQQQEENRLYHYHLSYRQPISSSTLLQPSDAGSGSGVSMSSMNNSGIQQQDDHRLSQMGDVHMYYEPSSRSSSQSREMSAFGSQVSTSNMSATL